jgi:hypothetical protein
MPKTIFEVAVDLRKGHDLSVRHLIKVKKKNSEYSLEICQKMQNLTKISKNINLS